MNAVEVNFDGIVGPTHNYSGLSYGNIASMKSQSLISNPKEAALQGLEKMKLLASMGIPQAVIPPQARPYIPMLRELGFEGNDKTILEQAYHLAPEILFSCSSAASMWAANAATVSPSHDTEDGKLHMTPANLSSKFHRSIEAPFTQKFFQKIFKDPDLFVIHDPLPPGEYFADEGAANHCRFSAKHGEAGLEMFVWGRHSFKTHENLPSQFPPRQVYEASQAIARRHRLKPTGVIFAQQNPLAIDAGVFHNDVISVSNEYVYFYHEKTFIDTPAVIDKLRKKMQGLTLVLVPEARISLHEAVASYVFNSQIVTLPDQKMRMIAPMECLESNLVKDFLQEMVDEPSNPITGMDFLNLHQSMANGGGPACLRLRIVLNEKQLKALHQGILLTDELYLKLKQWIEKYYRDRLHPNDLADIHLFNEVKEALSKLTTILQLGSLYYFQR